MADATEERAGRLLEAAERIRVHADGLDPGQYNVGFYLAVATMLEVEGNLRLTQPRGFYEVAEADTIADTILEPSDA